MLSPNAISNILLPSRSPSASSSSSGRAQKCKRQHNGDSVTRFVGRGMLLVLTAVLSGVVCYAAVGAQATTASAASPQFEGHREVWPEAAVNVREEGAAAQWVPGGGEKVLPGAGVFGFATAKGGDLRHPSLRATQGHATEGRAHQEEVLVEGGPRYVHESERHGVDLEDEDEREAKHFVVAGPCENEERKRLRSRVPSSSTTGSEKGPLAWHVAFPTSKDAEREEEDEGQEEERRRARSEGVEEESKKLSVEGKVKTQVHKEDEREEMKEEDEDVRAEGKKKAEQGGKQEHTSVGPEKKVGSSVRVGKDHEAKQKKEQAGAAKESGTKKEGDDVTTEGKTEADTKDVKKAEDEEGDKGLDRAQWLLDRARQILERPLVSEQMIPLYTEHPLCITGSSRWCGGETKRNEGMLPYTFRDMLRPLDALVWSIFKLPSFDIPFPFPSFPMGERAAPVHVSGRCRYVFTIDMPPLDDIRLYVTPSELQVGLAADRKVKRSEEGKTYSQVYGTETRLHAVASIAEGCMVSEELVKAGLIGWSFAGKTEGNMDILVAFPSEAHAKDLLEQKELTEDAYKRLVDGKGLEQLKPSEKCLLSGRTQSECDKLKAQAGGKHEKALTVSTEGYEDDQIRLPEFIYD